MFFIALTLKNTGTIILHISNKSFKYLRIPNYFTLKKKKLDHYLTL